MNKDFSNQYRKYLSSYLAQGGEGPLHHAYELGRRALSEGLGLLDLTHVHRIALEEVFRESGDGVDGEPGEWVLAANHFLEETLSPFEVSRLSNQDANNALRKLYEVLEEESKRIAHVLHDESAQILATVYLELAEISRDSTDSTAERINRVVRHLDEVREQLRGLSHELRPLILDQLGLVPALRFLADGVTKRSGLEVEVEGETSGRLSQSIEIVLYRTVQEALQNITRHACARRAEVRVWIEEGVIHCLIKDDGVGFAIPDERKSYKGLGLVGMQERVGALQGDCSVLSTPGEGTEVKVAIPL